MQTTNGRKPTRLLRWEDRHSAESDDWLAEESPLELVVRYPHARTRCLVDEALALTMRTPGADKALACGLLLAEGMVEDLSSVRDIVDEPGEAGVRRLVIQLESAPHRSLRERQRGLYANSSCGVCGKSSLQTVHLARTPQLDPLNPVVSAETLQLLPERLRMNQGNFAETGGLHAAALFSNEGVLYQIFEDIGRHNALDKLLGQAARDHRWPLQNDILLLSGRVSFELVQKAAVAGLPVIAAIGAPSSLAVELAQRFGQTLVGFLRGERFNIYTHPQRVSRS